MAAYRAYHAAMSHWATYENIHSDKYPGYLEEAVRLDPKFAQAWAELVSALSRRSFSAADPIWQQRAEDGLATLATIAPQSADHRFTQASYVYYSVKDYDKAHDLIRGALALQPSSVRALELQSWVERRQGNFDVRLDTMRELYALSRSWKRACRSMTPCEARLSPQV